METMVQGSRKPDLEIVCEDAASVADWPSVTASDVTVNAYLNGALVFSDHPDEVTLSQDGKSIVVRRVWGAGETGTVGRMWIDVEVAFGTGFPQTFPPDGPLRLDIVPGAAGT